METTKYKNKWILILNGHVVPQIAIDFFKRLFGWVIWYILCFNQPNIDYHFI